MQWVEAILAKGVKLVFSYKFIYFWKKKVPVQTVIQEIKPKKEENKKEPKEILGMMC